MKNKLRISLLLDEFEIPIWTFKMLEEIKKSPYAELVLIVKNKSKEEQRPKFIKRQWNNRNRIFHLLYRKFDKKFFKSVPDAFEIRNLNELLTNESIFEVEPVKTKFRDKFNDSDLEIIDKHNIDVFIRLGFRILSGRILKVAKYGVWSYHHGDNSVNRGSPPGFWEVMEGWDETGVILQILNENLDAGQTLFKSYSATHAFSVNRNLNNYYWKALFFIPNKLKELYTLGEKEFFKNIAEINRHPEFYSNRLFVGPSNGEMIRSFSKNLLKKLKSKVQNILYTDQYILLFKFNKIKAISKNFYQFKEIVPPKDRFWADPFVIKKNEKYYIFIEELMYATQKGHISVIEMDDKGNYSAPVKVLDKEYHLSYPFLIEDGGELYMIPETSENRTVELYKCLEFPLKWKFEMVLMDNIEVVDATILYKDNKYWMFANTIKIKGAPLSDELFLFSSKKLNSTNWIPHPKNPIVSDVKSSRPAGNLFNYNDRLYRPSQNGLKRYGYGMKINEVELLNELDYKETVVSSIYPNWNKGYRGTHTLNSSEYLTVIDAIKRRRK